MSYQPPSIEELEKLIIKLDTLETGHTNVVAVIKHQDLLPWPITKSNINLVLGILVYAWKHLPASTASRFGIFGGSRLTTAIEEGLKINGSNNLDKASETIYLTTLHQHMRKLNLPPYKKSDDNQNNVNLSRIFEKLEDTIKTVLIQSCKHINDLTHKKPNIDPLLKNFANLPDRYIASKQDSKKIRTEMVDFLRAFEKECLDRHVDRETDATQELTHGYRLRYSALVYIMAQIESEYSVLYPQGGSFSGGSDLYKLCQQILHIDSTNELTSAEKASCFSTLFDFIPKYALEQLLEQLSRVREPIGTSWKNTFPESKAFFMHMELYLSFSVNAIYAKAQKQDPHPYLDAISKLVNTGAAFTFNIAISTAAGMLPIPISLQVLQRAFGTLGEKNYGYMGRVLGEQIGANIERGSLSSVAGRMASRSFNFAANVPGNVVYYTLLPPALICNKLAGIMAKAKTANPYEQQAYIDALLVLPDKLMPADEKIKLHESKKQPPMIELDELGEHEQLTKILMEPDVETERSALRP